MSKWLELAERCEKATGADREIDFAIGFATGWRRDIHDGNDMIIDWEGNMFPDHYGSLLPSVTESLDAITALIERELPGWAITGGKSLDGRGWAYVSTNKISTEICYSATEALARCTAFCRAKAAKEASA